MNSMVISALLALLFPFTTGSSTSVFGAELILLHRRRIRYRHDGQVQRGNLVSHPTFHVPLALRILDFHVPNQSPVLPISTSNSALIREPLADRNQFLEQHILQPSLRSVIPDCYGANVNADQVRHLAKPDTP
jgi:hypothetical protein